MIAYFFGNMYLSSIQQGIQAQHCTAEMFLKYRDEESKRVPGSPYHLLYEWAQNHKTTVLLNGGEAIDLYQVQGFLASKNNPYPWASFHESGDALNGALTCVGVILPGMVHDTASEVRDSDFTMWDQLTPWEQTFVTEHLNSCGLAR